MSGLWGGNAHSHKAKLPVIIQIEGLNPLSRVPVLEALVTGGSAGCLPPPETAEVGHGLLMFHREMCVYRQWPGCSGNWAD